MYGLKAFVMCCMVAAAGLIVSSAAVEYTSPCPTLFRYEQQQENVAGEWRAELTLISDADLHGAWIRLFFDDKVSQLIVDDNSFQAIPSSDNEVLIKNPRILLKAKTPRNIKITVKYDNNGNNVPKLIGYRLNAKTVCPSESNKLSSDEYFTELINPTQFINSIKPQSVNKIPDFKCGIKSEKSQISSWQAHLLIQDDNKNNKQFVCDATLISPTHVITAAHCVTYKDAVEKIPEKFWSVHLDSEKRDVKVKTIIVHPAYDNVGLENDVALIELESPINNVVPICLPSIEKVEDKKGVVSGHKIAKKGNEVDLKLVSVDVKEIRGDECGKRDDGLASLIADNTYCASYISDDSNCVGQSGNSLTSVRQQDDKTSPTWELRGIVTVGPTLQNKDVCNQSTTILLADVRHYVKWIRSNTGL